MKIKILISMGLLVAVMLIMAMCLPAPAIAASTVAISSAGDGVFLVQGIGIEDAAALEINVSYDTATLANPRVVTGPLVAGSMNAVNPNLPGMVRMVIIRLAPVKGSGVIATLTFDRRGTSPGIITSLSAKLANINGVPLQSLVQVNNPTATSATASEAPQGQEAPAATTTAGQTSGTTGVPSAIAPTIIIAGPPSKTDEAKTSPDIQGTKEPGDRSVPQELVVKPREEPTLMVRKAESTTAAADAAARAKTVTREIYTQKSILDRFQEYKGKRAPEAFISLFEQDSMFWYHQDPPVALSDGKTAVRVTFISNPGNKTSSDVSVMGARLISIKPDLDNTNTWVVELVPEKGAYRASIAVSQGDGSMVYPLTIAPKVVLDRSRPGAMTKEQFDHYFSEQGSAAETKIDANKDGKRDYIDDYIITANYIAAARATQDRKPD